MRKNVQSIQFLRFVAAALVVVYHLTVGFQRYYPGSISSQFAYLSGMGVSGVHIFFVISGFVMVYTSFPAPDSPFFPPKFFVRRFIRIFPIYWIYAVVYLLFHNGFEIGYSLSFGQIVRALLLFPVDSANIIGPGWTLSFELYFYLCFGIAMTLGLHRGLWLLTLCFLSLAAMRYPIMMYGSHTFMDFLTNSIIVEFLFGAWIAYFIVLGIRFDTRMANAMLAASGAAFFVGCAFGYARLPSAIMWGIPSALAVAGFVYRERNGQLFGLIRRWSWLGDSSYSLYLLHVLLVDMTLMLAVHLYPNMGSVFTLVALFLAILVFCILVSAAAYALVEHRLIVFLHNLAKNRIPRLMGVNRPAVDTVLRGRHRNLFE